MCFSNALYYSLPAVYLKTTFSFYVKLNYATMAEQQQKGASRWAVPRFALSKLSAVYWDSYDGTDVLR